MREAPAVTLAHPFRLVPAAGSIATLPPGSSAHAAQLAGHALSCVPGERGLAPGFGLAEQAGGQVDPGAVQAVLAACTPELAVDAVTVTDAGDGQVDITVTVSWDIGED